MTINCYLSARKLTEIVFFFGAFFAVINPVTAEVVIPKNAHVCMGLRFPANNIAVSGWDCANSSVRRWSLHQNGRELRFTRASAGYDFQNVVIRSRYISSCLTIRSNQQATTSKFCTSTPGSFEATRNELWNIESVDSAYSKIINVGTGNCLTLQVTDLRSSGASIGVDFSYDIFTSSCTGSSSQLWYIGNPVILHSPEGAVFQDNTCLAVTNAAKAAGANVQKSGCNGVTNSEKQWVFVPDEGKPTVQIVNLNSGYCLDAWNGNIDQWNCRLDIESQRWMVSPYGFTHELRNGENKCVTENVGNGTNVFAGLCQVTGWRLFFVTN